MAGNKAAVDLLLIDLLRGLSVLYPLGKAGPASAGPGPGEISIKSVVWAPHFFFSEHKH